MLIIRNVAAKSKLANWMRGVQV